MQDHERRPARLPAIALGFVTLIGVLYALAALAAWGVWHSVAQRSL